MADPRTIGVVLGATSLLAGVASAALDTSALGLVAGATGLGAAAILARAATTAGAAREAERAHLQELETAVVAAWDRAAEAESALAEAGTEPDAPTGTTPEDAQALVDPVTGLYGERFFAVTLTYRVAAARRHLRPVAVVLIEVASGVKEGLPSTADAGLVSRHVKATLREADTACHLDGNRFGLVLEDTPENGAVWTVERVRRALNVERRDLTLWAGVACYPAHAFDADELFSRASAALEAAKEWRQDRIEVATTSDV